ECGDSSPLWPMWKTQREVRGALARRARGPYQSGNELPHSKEPAGVGRGAGRPSVWQPRLPLQPDKPAGGGLTIFPAGVVFDRSGPPPNCPYVRTVARA
ncbi:MAG: hypothetical protein ACLQNE_30390, partial [Thermoguttaceae bacterium]